MNIMNLNISNTFFNNVQKHRTMSFGEMMIDGGCPEDTFVKRKETTENDTELSPKSIKRLKGHNSPTRLWVSDIDGTLRTIGEDGHIPASAARACYDLKKAGVDIAVATGKSYEKVKSLDIPKTTGAKYIITEHGARIQKINEDGTKELISEPIYLDIADSQLVMEKYEEYVQEKEAKGEDVHEHLLCYYHDNETDRDFIYTTTPVDKLSAYDRDYATQISSFDEVKDMQMTKVLFYKDDSTDYKDMEEIRDIFAPYLIDSNANIFVSSKLFCEILNQKASKGNATETILEDINKRNNTSKKLTLRNVVSIGDADNDISSIVTVQKNGGIGIAMGNGTENLKSISNFHTDDIKSHGYANAANIIIGNNRRLAASDLISVLSQIKK